MKGFVINMAAAVCVTLCAFAAGEAYGSGRVREYASAEATNAPELDTENYQDNEKEKSVSDIIESGKKTVVGVSSGQDEYGSGVVVSEKGYILTHTAALSGEKSDVEVTFYDGRTEKAESVWEDPVLGIAVIKTKAQIKWYAKLADSKNARAGDKVVAIGNPYNMGFSGSAALGIVSSSGRTLALEKEERTSYIDAILQTDAKLTGENQGVPLFNMKGEVLGINMTFDGQKEMSGLAVPADVCEGVIIKLEETGSFEAPVLGFSAYSSLIAGYLMHKEIPDGVFVSELDRRGPAYEAGMRYGDIIESVCGETVSFMTELKKEVFKLKNDEDIVFSVRRGNEKKTITLIRVYEEETETVN